MNHPQPGLGILKITSDNSFKRLPCALSPARL
jgi:hypothetical protein